MTVKLQSTICPKCGKLVPRMDGICCICGAITETTTIREQSPAAKDGLILPLAA